MTRMKFRAFPKNVLVLNTHGSAEIPEHLTSLLSEAMKQDRILLNASDHGVGSLLQEVPVEQLVTPRYSRLIGDPNRPLVAQDLFRTIDFSGNSVWNKDFTEKIRRDQDLRNSLLELSYTPYFDDIFARLETMMQWAKSNGKSVVTIWDNHDTGRCILKPNPEQDFYRHKSAKGNFEHHQFEMPAIILSDQYGKTMPPKITARIQKILSRVMSDLSIHQSEIAVNQHYQGGYITQLFGGLHPETEHGQRLEALKQKYGVEVRAIQIEYDRGMYMQERSQTIDKHAAQELGYRIVQGIKSVS